MRALPFLIAAMTLGAVPAQAQELNRGTQRLEMIGDAGVACVAGTARPVRQDNATWQDGGPSGGRVVIVNLVDPNTATTRGSTMEVAVPLVCNAAHSITLRSFNGGLLREGSNGNRGTGGFSQFQTYDVSVAWQSQTARVGGATTSASLTQGQPAKGDLVVDIVVPRGTTPLVAGTYTDAVVVEIQPVN